MSSTPTYTVTNPSAGTEYIAPIGVYGFVPNANSTVTVVVQTFDASGNLITVSSMTAIVRDVSSGQDKGSYTGSNANTVTTQNTAGNGSDVYAPAGKINSGSPAQLRMYASYTGHAYDQPPNAPGNLTPSGLITTLTPTCTGTFSDPTQGDTLAQYEIQVNSAANGGGSQLWDSGQVTASTSEKNNAKFSRTYGGSALSFGVTYSLRARVANQNGLWSGYSSWVNFNTVQGPNAPTSVTPSGLQTSLTPAFGFTYTSPAGTAMQSYYYNINAANGGALVYGSGTITDVISSGSSVSGTIPSAAGLVYGGQYILYVGVYDANGAGSPVASSPFSLAAQPQAQPSSPIGNQTVSSQTPTFAFAFTDPNYTQADYQVQVLNKSTGALIWDSGEVASAATSVALGQIANPSAAPSLSASGSGSGLAAGTYKGAVTWINTLGETQASPTGSVVITAGQNVVFGALTLPANATGVKFYLSIAAGSLTLGFVGTNSTGAAFTATTYGNATQPPATNTTNVIPYNTPIQWRVQVWDTAGIQGVYSAYAYATVLNAPQAAITSPANNATILTNTPTITWTYTPNAGNFAQASASIALQDANGNTLQTYAVTGTGTSFTLPAGVLLNSTTYQLVVTVTDTNNDVGASPVSTFTLLYTPPADMQGQPLANDGNGLNSPYLSQDGGTGVAVSWTSFTTGSPAPSATWSVDPNVVQPVQLASGDGPVTGAQKIVASGGFTSSGQAVGVHKFPLCSTHGWAPGSTRLAADVQAIVSSASGMLAVMGFNFLDSNGVFISFVSSATPLGDTNGAAVTLLGPQNVTIPLNCAKIEVYVQLQTTAAYATQSGTVWFYEAQLEAVPDVIPTDPTLNTDGGSGVASGWTSSTASGVTAAYSIDASITNPGSNGTGAQKVVVSADTAGAGQTLTTIYQETAISSTTLIPGTDSVIAAVQAKVLQSTGTPYALVQLQFYDGTHTIIGSTGNGNAVSSSTFAVSATAATLIPSNCVTIRIICTFHNTANGDLGTAWFLDAFLGTAAALASDANFIAGDLGTGYSFDANGFSIRTQLAGNTPTLLANPGADTDPLSATGGSIALQWDVTLADATRFTAYLIERRRQDQATDDTAWVLLATIAQKAVGSYTDFSAGSNTTYQYSVRQQIAYNDGAGSVGVSAHRAIVVGSVSFSPAWYLTNSNTGLSVAIYNLRLLRVSAKRKLAWKERATYSAFLGRVGAARDGGPAAGYVHQLTAYWDDAWGDVRAAVRRQLVSMQRLSATWYLKDPEGLVAPVFLQDVDFGEEDFDNDTLLTATLSLVQAADTLDY